jgi:uncharacterized membrane protein YczE
MGSNTVVERSAATFGVVAALSVVVGLSVAAYGLLLTPGAVLGGLWIVAIGLSIAGAALFSTPWSSAHLGVSPGNARTLSWTFVTLGLVLIVSFVLVNYTGFESGSVESGELSSGSFPSALVAGDGR